MIQAVIAAALAVGAYLLHRTIRQPARRPIDAGAVSRGWITEHRSEHSSG